MEPHLSVATEPRVAEAPMEVVERKGLGHPDTICDALAEEACAALCRAYLDRFGAVLHHNVDKVLLVAGSSRPAFGGGEVLAPIEIFVAGRATAAVHGVALPIDEIVIEACRGWISRHLRLDPVRHVRIHSRIRPGSAELVDLFLRQARTGAWMSNDTSCGVGFAPFSPLERAVLATEARINAPDTKLRFPAFGEDVKVMAVRRGDRADLTVATAFVGAHVPSLDAYREGREALAALALEAASGELDGPVRIGVNAADDLGHGAIYLTVHGTSAEVGDDGEAGRGNRGSGLITPYRPMTMESVAGKNPFSHVGKLYNVAAQRVAEAMAAVDGVASCRVVMVSRIGAPVGEPQAVELRVHRAEGFDEVAVRKEALEIVEDQLAGLGRLSESIARTGLPVATALLPASRPS